MKTINNTMRVIISSVIFSFIFLTTGNTQTILLTEGWESAAIGQTAPAGWTTEYFFGVNHTWFKQTGVNPSCSPFAGNRMVEFQSTNYGNGIHDRLKRTTPISTIGYSVVNVDFRWYTSMDELYALERVDVEWSTNGTTWANAGSFYRNSWTYAWRFENLNLPAGATNQAALYIAFHFYGFGGDNCHLDEVHVTGYTTAPTPPTVITTPSLYVGATRAHLYGTFNANGTMTTASFQYGEYTSYGINMEAGSVSGNTSQQLGVLAGNQEPLIPGRLYHYRAAGVSAGGTVYGSDMTFTMLDTVPTALTDDAYSVTSNSATVYGIVSANGDSTSVSFDYGTTIAYGTNVPAVPPSLPGDSIHTTVYKGLTGLTPNTLYHYRVKATNSLGTSYGADSTFTTTGGGTNPPYVHTGGVTSITGNSAQLHGNVNANGASTVTSFQYGLTTSYGFTVSAQTVTGNTMTPISANIYSLSPATTYHYRAVGTNAGGTNYGNDSIFTTQGLAPYVWTEQATNITGQSATLNGQINANNSLTTVTFQYGLTSSYGTTVTFGTVSGQSYVPVSFPISGLSPLTTYHFRVTGTNAFGTTYGYDTTFTTIVNLTCTAAFTSNPDSLNPMIIQFTDLSTSVGSITSWHWEFGDGQSQTVTFPQNPNVSHLYANYGIYSVCLTIQTSDSCSSTYCLSVTVGTPPGCDAAFTSAQYSGNMYQFTDQSTGNILSWSWNFGDPSSGGNNYSNIQNPVHAFSTPGNYLVCLTVQGMDSTCYDMTCDTVMVGNNNYCTANFSYSSNPNTTIPTQFVDLSQSSLGPIISWFWTFDDPGSGSSNTSTLQNPTHWFSSPGTYNVCLSIQGADSNCYDMTCKTVVVVGSNGCTADFMAIRDSLNWLAYHFMDQSYPAPGYWHWDFGDGTPGSNAQNPFHIFPATGSYIVCLTIISIDSLCTDTYCDTIVVETDPGCVSYFTHAATGLSVNFSGHMLNGQSATYYWDFGDNNTGQGQNVQHTYAGSGYYMITLTTLDLVNCEYVSQQTIQVFDSTQYHNLYGQVFGGNFPINSGIAMLFEVDSVYPYTMLADTCMIDSLGIYYFTNVPDGNYYIYAIPFYPIGYLPTYFGDALNWGNATLIELGEETNPYDIHLVPADTLLPGSGNISGNIITTGMKSGSLTDKIMVLLMNKEGQTIANVRLNNQGEFEFLALAYGTYLIKPELAGIASDIISVDLTSVSPDTSITMTFTGNKILGVVELKGNLQAGLIYPNPATNTAYVVINSNRQEVVSVELFSISGIQALKMDSEVKRGDNILRISTGSLPAGFYIVRIGSGDNSVILTRKLVKSE